MTEEKRPLKVFLCHAHSDKDKVRTLYSRLKREGVDAWLDKEKLLPGSDWELEIRKAVREADVVVVCLSKQFNQAGFRQKEVRLALDTAMEQPEGEIFIIPARLEECENLESLRKWHWVDLFEADGYQRLIRALRARANRIDATLRIRKASQSITSRPKNKESEKKVEPPVSNIDIGDTVSANAIVTEIQETQNIERTEREATEETARENIEGDTVEKTKREQAESEVAKKDERERIDGETNEKEKREAVEKAAQEKDQKEIQRRLEKSTKKSKRDLWWGKLKIDIRYRFQVIYIYRVPILILLVTLVIVTPLLIRLSNLIPEITSEFNNTPTATIDLSITSQQNLATTDESFIPTATPLPTEITDAKGVSMVLVPVGEFIMGSTDGEKDERPAHTVSLDSFYFDRYEVTNKLYKVCVDEDVCDPPRAVQSITREDYYDNDTFNDFPVMRVDWYMANAFCEWRGARLPTEPEWEKAARGTDDRIYPWGNDIDCSKANYQGCVGDTTRVGSYKTGASPYGAYDMAGNVWEWVYDSYEAYPGSDTNISGFFDTSRIFRGGSLIDSPSGLRASNRNWYDAAVIWDSIIGFRCAKDVP